MVFGCEEDEKMDEYGDDEYYGDATEAETLFDEFAAKAKGLLKKSVIDYVEKTRKENEELHLRIEEVKQKECSLECRAKMLKRDKENMLVEVKKQALADILSELRIEVFTADYQTIRVKKCDKCNENRALEFTYPSGKKGYEQCECARTYNMYIPEKISAYKISNENGITSYFKRNDYTLKAMDDIHYGRDFSKVNKFSAIFATEKDCQCYCDYLNKPIRKILKNGYDVV
jgi:hypothetical protein